MEENNEKNVVKNMFGIIGGCFGGFACIIITLYAILNILGTPLDDKTDDLLTTIETSANKNENDIDETTEALKEAATYKFKGINLNSISEKKEYKCLVIAGVSKYGLPIYQILDCDTNSIDSKEYKNVLSINPYTSILSTDDGTHILLDHYTKEQKVLSESSERESYVRINDNAFYRIANDGKCYIYDSTGAYLEKKYDNICIDDNILYLVSNNQTEAVDLNTGDTQKINISAKSVKNHRIIYQIQDKEDNILYGLYYLEKVTREAVPKISAKYDNLEFFGTNDSTFIATSGKYSVVISDNDNIFSDTFSSDIYQIQSTNEEDNKYAYTDNNGVKTIINQYGNIVTELSEEHYLYYTVGDLVLYDLFPAKTDSTGVIDLSTGVIIEKDQRNIDIETENAVEVELIITDKNGDTHSYHIPKSGNQKNPQKVKE